MASAESISAKSSRKRPTHLLHLVRQSCSDQSAQECYQYAGSTTRRIFIHWLYVAFIHFSSQIFQVLQENSGDARSRWRSPLGVFPDACTYKYPKAHCGTGGSQRSISGFSSRTHPNRAGCQDVISAKQSMIGHFSCRYQPPGPGMYIERRLF